MIAWNRRLWLDAPGSKIPLPGGETAIYNASGLEFIRHKDWLGSSRLATTWAHGVYSKEAYAPFGETYNEAGTPDRSFTGQDQDTTYGVYDYLFRKYDTAAGRWLSPDPSGWKSVSQKHPQSLNRYAYVQNNPLSLIDGNGLACVYSDGNGGTSIDNDEGDQDNCESYGGVYVEGTLQNSDIQPVGNGVIMGDDTYNEYSVNGLDSLIAVDTGAASDALQVASAIVTAGTDPATQMMVSEAMVGEITAAPVLLPELAPELLPLEGVAVGGEVAAETVETGVEEGAFSVYDTSITSSGSKYLNVGTNVPAGEFQTNLISNGYSVVNDTGSATILSDGAGNTYTIYTRTSTGSAGAQFFGANGSIVKFSLGVAY